MRRGARSLGACLHVQVDLAAVGLPGVVVKFGLRGELLYTLCTKCFSWTFEAQVGFEYGLPGDWGAALKAVVSTSTELQELPCEFATGGQNMSRRAQGREQLRCR